VKDLERHPGGKGINIAIMLAALGAEVIATGFMGRAASRFIQEELHRRYVTTNFVHINHATRHNYFIIDEARDERTLVDEEGPEIEPDELRYFMDNLKRLIKRISIMVIAGSLPKNLDSSVYCDIIDIANEAGVRTVLNTQEQNLIKCMGKNLFITMPDTRSSERILGEKIDPELDRKKAACQILGKGGGASILTFDYRSFIVSTPQGCKEAIMPEVETRSQLKTGDGMIAGMVYSLHRRPGLQEAIRWGVATAAASSTYRCRFIQGREEVEKHLDNVVIKEV